MRIVAAEPRHAAALANAHARCFRDGWDEHVFGNWLQAENTLVLLAEITELQIAGFVVIRSAADESEVVTLGVVPEHRNAGVGMSLMQGAMTSAVERGGEAMFLEVDAGNGAALRLYRRLAFVEVGRRRNYYRDCEAFADALVLRRTLMDGN
ncbi:MAG: ribosomal protein S18-alanine N-acetyltransferase [Alphaproteobacteria bacterium]|nr:ribosomal protein S18-alanine N-acetyltransferase [Alphaproteobacteria bacterium]